MHLVVWEGAWDFREPSHFKQVKGLVWKLCFLPLFIRNSIPYVFVALINNALLIHNWVYLYL